MQIADAVKERIINLCHDNNISINKLAVMGGQTQSTLQSLIDGKSKNPKLLTLVRVCDSLNITLKEFFDDDLFNNIDTEL
ncbi:MAG: helix-turn-helix transcriptional regulator [bacterium]|nr:helix-turn-helix transcriptional regulator [bacterium]MDY4108123.1 helix-turn-helix transcriptional regulator [Bacilli bacterium]